MPFWTQMGSDWACSVISNGLRLEFASTPPFNLPLEDFSLSAEGEGLVTQSVRELEEKGAIRRISPQTPGFYSRMFLVPKPSGAFRPVLDLTRLNRFIIKKHFRMESFSSIRPILRKATGQ